MIKMSPFVVSIAFLAVLSVAHCDVSHLNGYHYPNFGQSALHTPESPPPTQYQGDIVSSNLPNSYKPPPSGSPFDSVAPLPQAYTSQRLSAPLQSPLLVGQKYQSQQNYQQTQPQTKQYQASAYQAPAYQAPAYQAPTYQAQNQAYQTQNQATSTVNAYSQPAAYAQAQVQQPPLITKHFYVHAAPEDPEEEAGPRYVQVGRARKNYKIIFIKAPTYSSKSQIIPILPQNEDKTIVYVLSKKPTFEQNVQLPELPVTEPSKPDVFFIKYKTQQEAEQAQQSIQAAYDQANLASADSSDDIASRFVSNNDSGSTAFESQDSAQPNQFGGQYSSTTQVKRSIPQKRY